jgi:2-haloacid dehalogenase
MSIFVFDAYGTLFNVHAAILRCAPPGPDAERLSEIWRLKQLEYSWTLTLADRYADFWTLTEAALDFALARVSTIDKSLKPQLLDAYAKLDSFPDAGAALRRLKRKGHQTAILSNGSAAMLNSAIAAADIAGDLDAVLSVDTIRMFKPRAAVYALVTDQFRCDPAAVSFVSSNRWDIMGAAAFGFRAFWINRTGMPDEYLDLLPERVLSDLAALG